MVDPHTTGCPEPEVLAAYVDRGLSLTERARVDAHLASCPQCIALVAGVARTVADVSALVPDVVVAAEATPLVTRRALAGAVAAAAAVIAVLAAPSVMRPWLDRDAELVSLVGGVGEHRSVLGRLTGGFPHAPLGVPPAGGQGGRAAGTDRVQLTAGKIRESFGERETPSQLHALGVSQLLAGAYDDAAQSLLAASREQPANARYLNDVATVQLERARLGLRPDDLPRALAAADRARRIDPSLKEAWFNRALAVSALSLTDEATRAWTEYLKRDGVSPWASEARSRLADLAKPTPAQAWVRIEAEIQRSLDAASAERAVRAQMTEARMFIEATLLPQWAVKVESGQDASHELERLRLMASAMLRVGGDPLYEDAVAAIDRAQSHGAQNSLVLARAHSRFARASALFVEDRFAEAKPHFMAIRKEFMNADSPFAVRCAVELGAIGYATGQSDQALTDLGGALQIAQARNYAASVGRIRWFQGLIAFGQGRLGDAQGRYEETLAEFERMGDAEQTAAAHNLLASLFGYLGDEESAWRHREAALPILAVSRSLRLRYGILVGATAAVRRQDPATALAFQDAVIKTAHEWGRPIGIAESLSQRAELLSELGRQAEGAAALAAAREALPQIADPAFRRRFEVVLLAAESKLLRLRSPAEAVTAATRAIDLVDQTRDRRRLPQLNLSLAKANIVWGRIPEAEIALRRGLEAFEAERSSISEEGRLSALDESWELFDSAIYLAIKKGDYARAFDMSERARTRTVAEARLTLVRSLSDVQASLGADEAILNLNQFEDALAVWVIRRDHVKVALRPVSRFAANQLVARQRVEIDYELAGVKTSPDLFNEIMRPVATELRGVERLTIIPGKVYEHVAFSALWNTATQRFLVEDRHVSIAPSASAYAAVRNSETSGAGASPLIISGLHQRDDDARAVAAVYAQSRVIAGGSATRSRFFADAPGHSVVHIVAPTASNEAFPLLSRMSLVDDPGRSHSGAILGSEIAGQRLTGTKLVVLDEHRTTSARRGEGTLSLARAFMAAGVPAVLGTLPGASETATRDFMIGFHREIAQNAAAGQALSTIQRNAIQQNGRRLGAWTALVLYGSDR
jgi:CHAT domain-containing protein